MRNPNARRLAIGGVFLAAVLAACLVIPAARQLGASTGWWAATAILGLPTAAVLALTGYRYYGGARSIAIAVVVAVLTCVVSFLVAVFAFASALSGSATGVLLGIVLFGAPALTVVIFGLLAQHVAGHRSLDDHDHGKRPARAS